MTSYLGQGLAFCSKQHSGLNPPLSKAPQKASVQSTAQQFFSRGGASAFSFSWEAPCRCTHFLIQKIAKGYWNSAHKVSILKTPIVLHISLLVKLLQLAPASVCRTSVCANMESTSSQVALSRFRRPCSPISLQNIDRWQSGTVKLKTLNTIMLS